MLLKSIYRTHKRYLYNFEKRTSSSTQAYTFITDTIHLLRFVLDQDRVKTDIEKVTAVAKYKYPENRTELRAFLGLAMYYRQFIKDFAIITAPLNKLLCKNEPFRMGMPQLYAMLEIKFLLSTEPVLATPDWTKMFTLYTDASARGLGAVLSQQDNQGRERVILYQSRAMNKTESNYGPTKLKYLAVVWAVKKLRYYLIERYFKVVTDHSALKWLFDTKDPHGMIARWIVVLQEYDMKIKYHKGSMNQNADALSRAPLPNGAQGGAEQ